MGYAGNKEPQFIIPSAIAVKETAKVVLFSLIHELLISKLFPIYATLIISHFPSIGSEDPPPLGVKNVKIQENSEKIRGPPGDP